MFNAGHNQNRWPKEKRVWKNQWHPGLVIRTVMCERCNAGGTHPEHEYKLCGDDWAFAKPRPLIVIAKHHFHAIALPVYTHGGNGLKANLDRNEYVQVLSDGIRGRFADDTVRADSSLPPPLLTRYMKPGVQAFRNRDLSYVHIAHPVCIGYDIPVAAIGDLEHRSLRQLQRLYRSLPLEDPETPTSLQMPEVQALSVEGPTALDVWTHPRPWDDIGDGPSNSIDRRGDTTTRRATISTIQLATLRRTRRAASLIAHPARTSIPPGATAGPEWLKVEVQDEEEGNESEGSESTFVQKRRSSLPW